MSTTSPRVAEGARLAIALCRAWDLDDTAAQQALLRQITAAKQVPDVLLAMTAMLVNAVGMSAAGLPDATRDDVWGALLQLHGEVRP